MNNWYKPGISIDQVKEEFLKNVASDENARAIIFELLDLLWEFRDASDGSEFLAGLIMSWATNEGNDLNSHRYDIRNVINHACRVKKLKDVFETFNDETSFTSLNSKVTKKEVSHE